MELHLRYHDRLVSGQSLLEILSFLDIVRESWLTEVQPTWCLTEAYGVQSEVVDLVEDIGEEGINCMVGRELLPENEKIINVVEDPMDEGTQ